MQAQTHGKRLPFLREDILSWALAASGVCMLLISCLLAPDWAVAMISPACAVAALASCALLGKSIRDFSRTGPAVRQEITKRYRWYGAYALARLTLAAFGLALFWSIPGTLIAVATSDTLELNLAAWVKLAAAALSLLAATVYAGCRALLLNPGLIVASWQYRTARVHRLWSALTPKGLRLIAQSLVLTALAAVVALAVLRMMHGAYADAFALLIATLGYGAIVGFALWEPEGKSAPASASERPNIVMIGCDTLRADRIGAQRDGRSLTPNIDRLAARGTQFTACYVPCARTAPSLISLLTGLWPHRHGVRDNFVAEAEAHLDFETLPKVLRQGGYRTAAVSDWCGADLGKFPFGFDILQLPDDQWNLKYLIRQGPKDIRLFISLFAQNRIGRLVLPEIYYLGGVPQTSQLGRRSRHLITRLAATRDPFLLNIFYSTTHPPFASEYPYYLRHAKADYKGESKFAMARLTEPFEIIRRQGEPREEFDLDQILDLYDGCVTQFDDEVGRVMQHLDRLGLSQNTIVVLYSDHGMEFFEHGTWGQGNSALGDFSARVPLIVAAPGVPAGSRVEGVTRTIDFLPTILELLGAPAVACDGASLVSLMKDPSSDLRLKAFNETGMWITPPPGLPDGHLQYPSLLELLDVPDDACGSLAIKAEFREQILAAKDRMIRDGDWKLVYQPLTGGKRLTLYNLSSDPGCNCDVSELYPDETARLWAELHEWMKDDTLPSNNGRLPHEEVRSVA